MLAHIALHPLKSAHYGDKFSRRAWPERGYWLATTHRRRRPLECVHRPGKRPGRYRRKPRCSSQTQHGCQENGEYQVLLLPPQVGVAEQTGRSQHGGTAVASPEETVAYPRTAAGHHASSRKLDFVADYEALIDAARQKRVVDAHLIEKRVTRLAQHSVLIECDVGTEPRARGIQIRLVYG